MAIALKTPQDVQHELSDRFKARRLALNLTQEGLARRSGVNRSSLKRFERTGLIALNSLLKLALVLDCLSDFDKVGAGMVPKEVARSLDEILADQKKRKKGSIK